MYKRVTFVLLFAMPLVLTSCIENCRRQAFSYFESVYNLEGRNAGITENYKSCRIRVYDSLYILIDTPDDSHQIHIYNKDFRYILSSGRTGRGPGEIVNPLFGPLNIEDGIIWYLDMGRRELLKFPVDSMLSNPGFLPHESVPIPQDIFVIVQYTPFKDGLISFSDIYSRNFLISFFNRTGDIVDTLGIKKREEFDNLNISRDQFIVPYLYDMHPNGELYAIAYQFSDIISVVDSKGEIVAFSRGPDGIDQAPVQTGNPEITTYADLRCDENYIYALYYGDQNDEEQSSGILHVFDWKGNPIAKINLEQPAHSFTIDNNLGRIVTFSPMSGDIVYYDLPSELHDTGNLAISQQYVSPGHEENNGNGNSSTANVRIHEDFSYNENKRQGEGVTDIDGNQYETVVIGNQEWMAENLKTTTYRDGTPIPNVTGNNEWRGLATGAYAWYDNDESYGAKYGALYNVQAAKDERGLCPEGWRVPSDSDWKELRFYAENYYKNNYPELDKNSYRGHAGHVLKSASGWHDGGNGTDDLGFSALPAGRRYHDGVFSYLGENACFWSTSGLRAATYWFIVNYDDFLHSYLSGGGRSGFSVRCVRGS